MEKMEYKFEYGKYQKDGNITYTGKIIEIESGEVIYKAESKIESFLKESMESLKLDKI